MSGRFVVRRAPVSNSVRAVPCSMLAALLVTALLPGVAGAQTPAQDPAQNPAQNPAEAPRFGRIAIDQAQLYCWPSVVVSPPRFEDTLAKDQVVMVGRNEGDFVQIKLPLGPTGYVTKRFSTTDENGVVRTKGTKVSFRYRTRTAEAPVQQLPDGTELFVIGEHEDWWRVRLPAVEAWLPQTAVTIGDQSDPKLAADYAASKALYDNEVNQRLEAIAAANKQAGQNKADADAVQLVEDAFQKELQKPVADQQFEPLTEVLDKVAGTLDEKSSAQVMVESLRKRIQAQVWIAEATALRDSKPVRSDKPVIVPQPKDDLERFHSIGWLRYQSRLGGTGIFYLEKGGLRLHHVTCATGRYDLALFIDCEIGIQGPRRRPTSEAFSVLDVERLEVLGHNRH